MIKTGLRKGFTLAEVLTTLMVIGVVAAMTIPTLINSTDDQQYKVAFKKSISILSQAIQLNQAKEEECAIISSKTLCDCFAKSMQGACTAESKTGNTELDYSTLTTPDGISYAFFFRGDKNAATEVRSFTDQCGDGAPTSEGAWRGEGMRCVAIVDVNGLSKGTKQITSNPVKSDSTEKLTTTGIKDQVPVLITNEGVYPAITNYAVANGHTGYDWMYGSGAGVVTPFTPSGAQSAAGFTYGK